MTEIINELEQIVYWPKKPVDKENVIQFLATKFDTDKKYSEKEINQVIKQFHLFNDIPLLRRELISRKHLSRKDDGSEYWKIK